MATWPATAPRYATPEADPRFARFAPASMPPADPPPWWFNSWGSKQTIYDVLADGSWAVYPQAIFGINGDDGSVINYALQQSGLVRLGPFTNYKWATAPQLGIGQSIIYDGPAGYNNCIVSWLGSGDALRQTFNGAYNGITTVGGGARGFRIDGASHAPGASSGLHAGDIESLRYDLFITNFSGAGDIGCHFDNTVNFTERLQGSIRTNNCTSAVVFDVNGGSGNSFARPLLDIFISSGGLTHNGVVIQNNANVYQGRLGIRGNFTSAASGTAGAALAFAGTGSPLIQGCQLDIGVESGAGTVKPQTINFGPAIGSITRCKGYMQFTGAGWQASNLAAGANFGFDGPINGDSTLVASQYFGTSAQGALATGGTINTLQGSVVKVNPGGAVTGVIMQPGTAAQDGQPVTVINLSANTITFAVPATSNVAASVTTMAANGQVTFYWVSSTGLWYGR